MRVQPGVAESGWVALVGSPSVDDLQAAMDCAGPVLLVVPEAASLDGLRTSLGRACLNG